MHSDYLIYSIPIIVFIFVVILIYIKVKYKFWSSQPVFHIYDFKYHLFPPGIIRTTAPEKSKFFDSDIQFRNTEDISKKTLDMFCSFIRTCYLQDKYSKYIPSIDNIAPYFNGHNKKSYISLKMGTDTLVDTKTQHLINRPKIYSSMTSRPMHCIIIPSLSSDDIYSFDCNYVDYLCIDYNERNKGLAAKTIYTHEYHHWREPKAPVVSVFKREDSTLGIIPICHYQMLSFDMKNWKQMTPMPSNMGKIVQCTPNSYYLVSEFIHKTKHNFNLYMSVNEGNIMELIRTKNIYVYMYVSTKGEIQSIFFFRKTCTFFDDTKRHVLACFASIRNTTSEDVFVYAFKLSVVHIVKNYKENYSYLLMENISNNNILISNLQKRTMPSFKSPASYFFYNFAYTTFHSNNCLIIN
jgi:hypothetical protein